MRGYIVCVCVVVLRTGLLHDVHMVSKGLYRASIVWLYVCYMFHGVLIVLYRVAIWL